MKRTPPHARVRSRRWIAGVTLAAAWSLSIVVAASGRIDATETRARGLSSTNAAGVLRTLTADGAIDVGNPFFQELGTNGRTCDSCHRPAQAWTITPDEVRDRFERTDGLDPIFRTNDGSTCANADVSTVAQRRAAYALLLAKGLVRVQLDVPDDAEFDIIGVDDPYRCGEPLTRASMYRRPLPTTNLKFLSTVMWDGRETHPRHAVRDDLIAQARDAVVGHAQNAEPSDAQLQAIVDFELGLTTAQTRDRGAGSLSEDGVGGGPVALSLQPFCIGINDPLGTLPSTPGACARPSGGLNPMVFSLFGAWSQAAAPSRAAIARGETIFNRRHFVIADVPGLNGAPGDPIAGPIPTGTCTVCHDAPNAGSHSVPLPVNVGIADASRRTPDLPLYTLRHRTTGELAMTTDPGRAMVTGRWRDIGKFKGPVLRALAARAPYFHDGSAATLADVVETYDRRFAIGLSAQEKADLVAFLQAL